MTGSIIVDHRSPRSGDVDLMDERPLWLRHQNANFVLFMACGGTSKLFATTLAYPHGRCASITSNADAEVARTRMREDRITSYNVCYTKLLRHRPCG